MKSSRKASRTIAYHFQRNHQKPSNSFIHVLEIVWKTVWVSCMLSIIWVSCECLHIGPTIRQIVNGLLPFSNISRSATIFKAFQCFFLEIKVELKCFGDNPVVLASKTQRFKKFHETSAQAPNKHSSVGRKKFQYRKILLCFKETIWKWYAKLLALASSVRKSVLGTRFRRYSRRLPAFDHRPG